MNPIKWMNTMNILGEQGIDLIGDNDNDEDPNIQELAKTEEEFDLK